MHNFSMKFNQNELDTEIDEFGDLTSVDMGNKHISFRYRRRTNSKVIDRRRYNKVGIPQVGTTYPNSYDRKEFIKLSKKPLNVYRQSGFAAIITVAVIIIDFFCYLLMLAGGNSGDAGISVFLVAIGIAIAIDAIPILIAHNLHREGVKRNKVLRMFKWISLGFIVIFLVVALLYRIFSLEATVTTNIINHKPKDVDTRGIFEAFFYFLIPIATSLFSFIVNYLNYNPVEKAIYRKRVEILFKQEDVNELKAMLAEVDAKGDIEVSLAVKDEQMRKAAIEMVESIGEQYKAYVRLEIMKGLRSPAASTQLSDF